MKILTISGKQDALYEHGMESLALAADLVINVDHDRRSADRAGTSYEHEHLRIDGPETVLFECLERIWDAWERAFPEEAHLAHAAGGFWLRFWLSPEMRPMKDLAAAGFSDDLRAAAADYIEAEFGNKRGPIMRADDDREHVPAGCLSDR